MWLEDIAQLPNPSLRVTETIWCIVKHLDVNNFVAEMPGANIRAAGDSLSEAKENLADIIAGTYWLFDSLPPESLGPEPTRQLSILKRHLSE
ncbi:MAG: hypothetical protein A2V70_06205 [Planctomycetes bacterium RBG_13_63_9]|nr:MAG: hypothetical protein A2V70_06205 [Planctomycetes bacterium RBG_13_63_9]